MTELEDDGPIMAQFIGGPLDGERELLQWESPLEPDSMVIGISGPGIETGDFYIRLKNSRGEARFLYRPLIHAYRHELDPDAAVWLSEKGQS